MISQNKPGKGDTGLGFGLAFCLLLVLAAGCGGEKDLTAEDVVQKNIEARGGAAAWAAIENLVMDGIYVSFSEEAPFKIWRMRPDLYRFDSTRIKKYVVHAYDGEKAWWINPLFGPDFEKAQIIPAEGNLDKVTLRERFFDPVFWYADKHSRLVELEGKEVFDDRDCWKLKVTLADESVEHWYIDAESFLEVGMTGETYDFGIKNNLEAFFGDWREVDGVMFPFLIESEYGQRYRTMEIENILVNTDIDPKVFVMPDL